MPGAFKRLLAFVIAFLLTVAGSSAQAVAVEPTPYPIILVHGFLGWGRSEMGGKYYYWGGFFDLETYLKEQGYQVFTLSVGPISSNYDRAVEAYYQIKGGQVNYGKAHSDRYGLIQQPEGKEYPGYYPQWDSEHPVHIVAHSMGGQTARVLEYLLRTVAYQDSSRTVTEDGILLGEAHDDWIKSITTISTPHDGTTLADWKLRHKDLLKSFAGLAAVAGESNLGEKIFDLDLEQWGLGREDGESWLKHLDRVMESSIWDSKNFSAYDLSLGGARDLNTLLSINPEVYYFSYGTSITVPTKDGTRQRPELGQVFPTLYMKAIILGQQEDGNSGGVVLDQTWQENDGVVNTISQDAPSTGLNGAESVKPLDPERLEPGVWQYVTTMRVDHFRVIGHNLGFSDEEQVKLLFGEIVTILDQLP